MGGVVLRRRSGTGVNRNGTKRGLTAKYAKREKESLVCHVEDIKRVWGFLHDAPFAPLRLCVSSVADHGLTQRRKDAETPSAGFGFSSLLKKSC